MQRSVILSILLTASAFGAQEILNLGTGPNTGDGDNLRTAFTKTKNNFSYLFEAITNVVGVVPAAGTLIVDGVNGDDLTATRGRQDLPFQTLREAFRAIEENDTLVIRPGVYSVTPLYYGSDIGAIDPDLYLLNKTNITILGYGATLEATEYGNMLTIEGSSRIYIRGLTFRGSEVNIGTRNITAAINHRGTNEFTTIQDCAFIDIADQAISHCWDQFNRPSYYWTIQNNWFHNIGQTNHPGVGPGLPDGAMVSGRPRRLIFTGNRSTGRNSYGVEFDGGGDNAPGNDPEIKNSVVANNILEGLYYFGVVLTGKGDTPVYDVTISGNVLAFHTNTIHGVSSAALIALAGARNVVITGNNLSAPITDNAAGGTLVLLQNPYGDGFHPPSYGLNISGNTFFGGSHGLVIAQTPGVASLVDGVRIVNNVFRQQGASHISVAGKAVQIIGNSFLGCGRWPDSAYTHAVRLWDFAAAPATGFVMRDNILDDGGFPALTTRMLRGFSDRTPRTPLDVRDNRIVRMSGTTPYQFSSDTPIQGDAIVLTDGATIDTPAVEGAHFRVTLEGNRVLANPTNPYDGQVVTWEIVQDGTGGRTISLGDKFIADRFVITLSTNPGARDFLTAIYNATEDQWYVTAFTGPVDDFSVAGTLTAGIVNVTNHLTTENLTVNTNATITGTVTAGALDADALAVGGSGMNEISLPLSFTDLSGNAYANWFGFSGSSTNGTNVSLWSMTVPEGYALHVSAEIASAGATESFGDMVRYDVLRAVGGSASIERTNHLWSLTNHWFSLDSSTLHLYLSAELTETMNSRGVGRYSLASIGSELWAPLIMWDFEGTGAPTGWTAAGTGIDYDYAVAPLVGTESLALTTDGTTTRSAFPPLQTAASEVWAAAAVKLSGNPSAAQRYIAVRNGSYSEIGRAILQTGRTVTANATGGTPSSATASAIATNAVCYIKVRYKKGTGANAEFETWITTDPSTGWGTGVLSNDGTATTDARTLSMESNSSSGADFVTYWDNVAYSLTDIPASYYE